LDSIVDEALKQRAELEEEILQLKKRTKVKATAAPSALASASASELGREELNKMQDELIEAYGKLKEQEAFIINLQLQLDSASSELESAPRKGETSLAYRLRRLEKVFDALDLQENGHLTDEELHQIGIMRASLGLGGQDGQGSKKLHAGQWSVEENSPKKP